MSKILELVACATSSEDAVCADVELGKIHNYQAQQINQKTGVQLLGATKVITPYGVRHIIKSHGNNKSEKERAQIGVVNSDFVLIDEILRSPDQIIKGAIVERNKQSIVFIKRIKNIEYFVAMLVEGKKDNLRFVLKTMYKK